MNGTRTLKKNRWRWSHTSSKSVSNVTKPLARRLLLLLPPEGLFGPWLTHRHWTPFICTSLKTLNNTLWASLFVGTEASSFRTRPVLHHQTKDSLSIRTKNLLPNNLVTVVTTSPLDRTPIAETRISPPSKVALSSRKGGKEEEIIKDNRTESLPVGRKLSRYQTRWSKLFPQFPETVRKISQGIFISLFDEAPSLSAPGTTQQPQAFRPSSCTEETLELSGQRRGDGSFVARILQPSFSGPQARGHLQTHHRSQAIESLSGHSFIQNGNPVLNHNSPSTTRMDYQNRPQRCLSSHSSSYQHWQVLPLCYSWKTIPVPCSPVWCLYGSPWVHQDLSSSGSAVMISGNPGPCLSGRLDHTCRFTQSESSTYHQPLTISRMDNELEKVCVDPLTYCRLPGTSFRSRESYHFPSRIIPSFSHPTPIPSVNIHGHACKEFFIHHQSHIALRSLHPSWPPATQVSPILDQATLDPTQAILGHSITTGCRIPFSSALVQQTGCSQGISFTSTGTQPVLFHRHLLNRLGSQLARSLPLRPMVSTGFQSAHQLARTRSHPPCSSQVGTSLDQLDSSRLLRQQYGGSSYWQAGRNPFDIAFQRNAGNLSSSGQVWNSTHPDSPSRSQECNSRYPVLSEQSKSDRMAAPSGNLTEAVLCLRVPPSGHSRYGRE